MLLQMRSTTAAARSICYATAVAIDISERAIDADVRQSAAARAGVLTPIAKAFSTEIGIETASLGVQVHGGMGFIEEAGAAQYYRDARIASIYEGANGIQGIDLVSRKLAARNGAAIWPILEEIEEIIDRVETFDNLHVGTTAYRLRAALGSLYRAAHFLLDRISSSQDDALAGTAPYLSLFGITLGGSLLAKEAMVGDSLEHSNSSHYTMLARYFAENVTVVPVGNPILLATDIESGDAPVLCERFLA